MLLKMIISVFVVSISFNKNAQISIKNKPKISKVEISNKSESTIRENYNRIKSIKNWTKIDRIKFLKSTEGGEAKFYYYHKKLEKIISEKNGGDGKIISEYYLKDGKLNFVFEKITNYSKPLNYDKRLQIDYNANVKFDLENPENAEERNYFENDILLEQISNQDCGSPFTKEYLLEEQERILLDFKVLMTYEIQQKHIK